MDALTLEAPAYSDHWSAVMMDDVHLYTAAQQQMALTGLSTPKPCSARYWPPVKWHPSTLNCVTICVPGWAGAIYFVCSR